MTFPSFLEPFVRSRQSPERILVSDHNQHGARARLTLVHEGNAVVAGVVPCLLGGTANARPDLHGSAIAERCITLMSAIELAYTVTRTRTSASVKTVVGARNLDGRLARVHDPVLSAGAVAIVTEFHVI